MRRYSRSRSELTVTSMPSATCVTQAGSSLSTALDLDQAQAAGADVAEAVEWQSVGMGMPFSRADFEDASGPRAR